MKTICPLCEATCAVRVSTENGRPTSVRGDESDPFSRGYICPKGVALSELNEDPDRIREPMVREGDTWRVVTWKEAFARIDQGWKALWSKYGKESLGIYLGNPSSHNLSVQLYGFPLFKMLGTPNFFSASTADQIPKHVSCGEMFGDPLSIPLPDINRSDYLLVLGANPLESNGSLMTAPDMPNRLKDIQRRGGRIIVVDPRRTKTAKLADRYHAIRPGTDAYFLAAVLRQLFTDNRVSTEGAAAHSRGMEDVRSAVEPFTPERAAVICGVTAEAIVQIAGELADAPSATIHARMGTTTQAHGTISSWLVDVIHVLTGNLDRAGGAMFSKAAHGAMNTKGASGKGKGLVTGRRKSRVRGYPEVMGEFPCGAMAEEISTPGQGQIKGMLTACGNPVLSTPNGAALDAALGSLEFMVSFDIYLNETTRNADVILPDVSPLERSHYDLIFSQLAIHNYARYTPPVTTTPGRPAGWEVLLQLFGIAAGLGPDADIEEIDAQGLRQNIEREQRQPNSRIAHLKVDEIMEKLSHRRGPERHLDFLLRSGPYGDAFDDDGEGLSLALLEATPEGIDLGAMSPRIPEVLRTPSGVIELAPEAFVAELATLADELEGANPNGQLLLIGRRHLRSNNSWMHNIPSLMRGRDRCTLMAHPDTATACGLTDGELVAASSKTGTIQLPLEVSNDMMPGVVSVPHGWGHNLDGTNLSVASANAGVNANLLADPTAIDKFSGNAILNGIHVTVSPVAS